MLDVQLSAELVELMLPALRPFTQTKEAVGELFAVVHCPAVVCLQTMRGGENGADPHSLPGRALHLQCPERVAGALQVPQKATRVRRSLVVVHADENPASGSIDRDKQIPA